MNETAQRDEIRNTHTIVRSATGIEMNLFTPPGGSFGRGTLRVVGRLGYTTIMPSRDTMDWRDNDTDLIFYRATRNVMNGDLVLLSVTPHSASILGLIIDNWLGRELAVVSVGDAV